MVEDCPVHFHNAFPCPTLVFHLRGFGLVLSCGDDGVIKANGWSDRWGSCCPFYRSKLWFQRNQMRRTCSVWQCFASFGNVSTAAPPGLQSVRDSPWKIRDMPRYQKQKSSIGGVIMSYLHYVYNSIYIYIYIYLYVNRYIYTYANK